METTKHMPTMFKRVGGSRTVDRIVDDYHAALRTVPFFQEAFQTVDMDALALRHRTFLTWILDGPSSFDNETANRLQADIRMTEGAFEAATTRLREVLGRHLERAGDVEHVMRAVFRREPLIVQPPGDG